MSAPSPAGGPTGGGAGASGAQGAAAAPRKPESLLLKLLREPSTSARMIRILNYTLAALLLSIVFTIAVGLGDVHTYVLAFLTVGLLASVNWFITQYRKVQAVKEAQAAAAESARRAAADAHAKKSE